MKIEIENPTALLLEIAYLNGTVNGKEIPELININLLNNLLLKEIKKCLK